MLEGRVRICVYLIDVLSQSLYVTACVQVMTHQLVVFEECNPMF